jgi:enoyl-CoA hydratase/carnithine racemase
MTLPGFATLDLSLTDGIGHLVLKQPPSNSMTLEFFREFGEAVDLIGNNPGFRALVISGHGRHFSSGAGLPALLEEIRSGSVVANGVVTGVPAVLTANYETFLKLERFEIPVISAIRGVCLGSALELTLFSHFRFCGEDAVFGLPETSFNLVPGLGGIVKMSALIGRSRALELVLKANTFSAAEALEMKFVQKILPKREVVRSAIKFAQSVTTDFHKEKAALYIKKYFA